MRLFLCVYIFYLPLSTSREGQGVSYLIPLQIFLQLQHPTKVSYEGF